MARHKPVMAAIEDIDESNWVEIDYTDNGVAQVAATTFGDYRLIVCRTKIDDPQALALFP